MIYDKIGLNFSLVHRRLKCEELIAPDTDDAFMWPLANWAKKQKKTKKLPGTDNNFIENIFRQGYMRRMLCKSGVCMSE